MKPQDHTTPVVHGYFICWNEEDILPHFLKHYAWLDKLVVLDNESDDRTPAILQNSPGVEHRIFKSNGVKDLASLTALKNEVWKESIGIADFVLICDIDEFLFHPDLAAVLNEMRRRKATVMVPKGFQMLSPDGPKPGLNLLKAITTGARDTNYDKCVLFDPNKISEIRYRLGSHICDPVGDIEYFRVPGLALLHYRYLSATRVLNRNQALQARMSKVDHERGLSAHQKQSIQQIRMTIERFSSRSLDVVRTMNLLWNTQPIQPPSSIFAELSAKTRSALMDDNPKELLKNLRTLAIWWPHHELVGALTAIVSSRSDDPDFTTHIAIRRAAAFLAASSGLSEAYTRLANLFLELKEHELADLTNRFRHEIEPGNDDVRDI